MIDGLEADVVTLALAYDIDAIAEGRAADRLAEAAARTTARRTRPPSVFLVRKGNPKGSRTGVTCRAGRAGDHAQPEDVGRRALELPGGLGLGAEAVRWQRGKVTEFVAQALRQRAGAGLGRARLDITFAERGIGDVLIAWENEAPVAKELGKDKFEIVTRRSASSPSRRWRWSTRSSTTGTRAWPRRI